MIAFVQLIQTLDRSSSRRSGSVWEPTTRVARNEINERSTIWFVRWTRCRGLLSRRVYPPDICRYRRRADTVRRSRTYIPKWRRGHVRTRSRNSSENSGSVYSGGCYSISWARNLLIAYRQMKTGISRKFNQKVLAPRPRATIEPVSRPRATINPVRQDDSLRTVAENNIEQGEISLRRSRIRMKFLNFWRNLNYAIGSTSPQIAGDDTEPI